MSVQGHFPVRQRIFQLVRNFSPILSLYYNAFLIAYFLFLRQLNYVNICNQHSCKVYDVFHGTCEVTNLHIRFIENFSQKEGATAIKTRNNLCTVLYWLQIPYCIWLQKRKTREVNKNSSLFLHMPFNLSNILSYKVCGPSRYLFILF